MKLVINNKYIDFRKEKPFYILSDRVDYNDALNYCGICHIETFYNEHDFYNIDKFIEIDDIPNELNINKNFYKYSLFFPTASEILICDECHKKIKS